MYDLERVPRPKLAELGPTWSLGSPWVEEVELGFQGVQESTGRFLKRAAQRERESKLRRPAEGPFCVLS